LLKKKGKTYGLDLPILLCTVCILWAYLPIAVFHRYQGNGLIPIRLLLSSTMHVGIAQIYLC